MKKQNNKGFSLIELLIAVAVMTILITPIISQLFETIKVSGQAKEKQYVVDSVDNVLENFRTFDDGQLKVDGDTISDPILGTVTRVASYSNVTCQLCKANGDPVDGSITSIDYNQINYELDDIGLGKSKSHSSSGTNYTRKVIKNDLNNKLAEAGFQIDYSISSSSAVPSGFEWRSDNIVAVSDSNDCFTSIVVKPTSGTVNDPNTISLANLQNIDASSIAIIQSDATTLDYQIEKDLSALLVTYAMHPDNKNTTIGQKAGDPKELNEFIKTLVSNPYAIDKTRSIHLTITAGKEGGSVALVNSKPKFYHVRCDVVYRIAFKGSSTDLIKPFSNNTSEVGSFSYNVLDRNYYTDKPTNVLLVYEPLLLSTQSGAATRTFYADNDYIDITTDDYTDGTQLGDKSTVYLIGSSDNWAKATNTPRDTYVNDGINYSMYRTYFGSNYRDVNIVVSQTPGGNPIDVYTNIGVGYNDTTGAYKKIPDDPNTNPFSPYNGHVLTRQFKIDGIGLADKPPVYKEDMHTSIGACTQYGTVDTSNVADPFSNIKPYYEENVTDEGRLYQVTVVYQNKDSNEKTYITGAKGAN